MTVSKGRCVSIKVYREQVETKPKKKTFLIKMLVKKIMKFHINIKK